MRFVPDLGCGLLRILFGTVVTSKGFQPEIDVQRIYYANHTSHLDFPLVWASLPSRLRHQTRPIAARDYWTKTAFQRFLACSVFRAVLIERGKGTVHGNPLEPIIEALNEGSSIIIFPEGTRSLDGQMQGFKSGLFHLAKGHPLIELVPVYLHNLNRIMPKGELVPLPLLSRVIFGAPINFAPGEEKEAFLKRAADAILELAP